MHCPRLTGECTPDSAPFQRLPPFFALVGYDPPSPKKNENRKKIDSCQVCISLSVEGKKFEVNYMETDIDDMIFGDCDPGPSDR